MRIKLLDLIRSPGVWNCTRLAEQVGQSTAAVSYHLRKLAEAGFIVQDAEQVTVGRQRWWRAVSAETRLDTRDGVEDVDGGLQFLRALAEVHGDRLRRYVDDLPGMPVGRQRFGAISDVRLRLTAEEFESAAVKLRSLIQQLRPDTGAENAPPGAVAITFQYQCIPDTTA